MSKDLGREPHSLPDRPAEIPVLLLPRVADVWSTWALTAPGNCSGIVVAKCGPCVVNMGHIAPNTSRQLTPPSAVKAVDHIAPQAPPHRPMQLGTSPHGAKWF